MLTRTIRPSGENVAQLHPTRRRRASSRPIAPWRIGSSTNFQESAAMMKIAATWRASRRRLWWNGCWGEVRTITGVCQR